MGSNLNAALERCINFLGDADSTDAIVGQLAGAIYGIGALHRAFVDNLQQWDDGEVAVRAYMLHFWGQQHTADHRPSAMKETNAAEHEQAARAAADGKHLWRRHYVGDREFWRWAGIDPASGQWYTKEEKDASIRFALPDADTDVVISLGRNEAVSDANYTWFDAHWLHHTTEAVETVDALEAHAVAAAADGKHLWRCHYVGDREFWRWAGIDPASGQWYTKEEKDASI